MRDRRKALFYVVATYIDGDLVVGHYASSYEGAAENRDFLNRKTNNHYRVYKVNHIVLANEG